MNLEKFEAERRRLAVLQLLESSSAYTADQTVILRGLESDGLGCSRDRLKTELAWLEEQGMVVGQQPGGIWVATLTVRGLDVANGYGAVPGIARPEPGE